MPLYHRITNYSSGTNEIPKKICKPILKNINQFLLQFLQKNYIMYSYRQRR